jgi:hypothetical protein
MSESCPSCVALQARLQEVEQQRDAIDADYGVLLKESTAELRQAKDEAQENWESVKRLTERAEVAERDLATLRTEQARLREDAWWAGRRSAYDLRMAVATGPALRERCREDLARITTLVADPRDGGTPPLLIPKTDDGKNEDDATRQSSSVPVSGTGSPRTPSPEGSQQ